MQSISSIAIGAVFSISLLERKPGLIIFRVRGKGNKAFLNESGGHRWQRVPPTEKRGRMQTSTITVAVLPETQKQEIHLKNDEIEMTFYRGTGPGGQHKNKTDSAVRIKHKPTGLIVCSEQERSQHLNKEIAIASLKLKLQLERQRKEYEKREQSRKTQVGTGMRGDKRRTIRMQDDTVADHLTGKRMRASKYIRGFIESLH